MAYRNHDFHLKYHEISQRVSPVEWQFVNSILKYIDQNLPNPADWSNHCDWPRIRHQAKTEKAHVANLIARCGALDEELIWTTRGGGIFTRSLQPDSRPRTFFPGEFCTIDFCIVPFVSAGTIVFYKEIYHGVNSGTSWLLVRVAFWRTSLLRIIISGRANASRKSLWVTFRL